MSLVPPEELANVQIRAPLGPIDLGDQQDLAAMVQAGFDRWRDFHERYGERQKQIRAQDPGLATWADVREFALQFGNAEEVTGFHRQTFRSTPGGPEPEEEPVTAIRFRQSQAVFAVGEPSGVPPFDPSGRTVPACGLNVPALATALRDHGLDPSAGGAVHLRAPRGERLPWLHPADSFGVLVLLRQALQVEGAATWAERGLSLHAYLVPDQAVHREIVGPQRAELVRWLVGDRTIRTAGPEGPDLVAAMTRAEDLLVEALRRPSESEISSGIGYGVRPLLAAIVTP
jgi:hypothetical protein